MLPGLPNEDQPLQALRSLEAGASEALRIPPCRPQSTHHVHFDGAMSTTGLVGSRDPSAGPCFATTSCGDIRWNYRCESLYLTKDVCIPYCQAYSYHRSSMISPSRSMMLRKSDQTFYRRERNCRWSPPRTLASYWSLIRFEAPGIIRRQCSHTSSTWWPKPDGTRLI